MWLFQRVRVSVTFSIICQLLPRIDAIGLLLSATDATWWSRSLVLHPKPDNLTWLRESKTKTRRIEHKTTNKQINFVDLLLCQRCFQVDRIGWDSMLHVELIKNTTTADSPVIQSAEYIWKCERVKGSIYHVFIYFSSPFPCQIFVRTSRQRWNLLFAFCPPSQFRCGVPSSTNVLTRRTGTVEWIKSWKFNCTPQWMVHLGSIEFLQIIEWIGLVFKLFKQNVGWNGINSGN